MREMSVTNYASRIATVIGVFFPALLFSVYVPVSLLVGDVLPGTMLYVVFLAGFLIMGLGVSSARLILWRKGLWFVFLTLVYVVEIFALAFLAIRVYRFDGVF